MTQVTPTVYCLATQQPEPQATQALATLPVVVAPQLPSVPTPPTITGGRTGALLQVGIASGGIVATSSLYALSAPGVAVAAAVLAGVASLGVAATALLRGHILTVPAPAPKPKQPEPRPTLSAATRDAIVAGLRDFNKDGIIFVTSTESGNRHGGAGLPPKMVLGALAEKGHLFYGGSRRGDRGQETVWSSDALRVESVKDLCELLGVDLPAPVSVSPPRDLPAT